MNWCAVIMRKAMQRHKKALAVNASTRLSTSRGKKEKAERGRAPQAKKPPRCLWIMVLRFFAGFGCVCISPPELFQGCRDGEALHQMGDGQQAYIYRDRDNKQFKLPQRPAEPQSKAIEQQHH